MDLILRCKIQQLYQVDNLLSMILCIYEQDHFQYFLLFFLSAPEVQRARKTFNFSILLTS